MYDILLTSETKKGVYFFKWTPGIIAIGFGCFSIYSGLGDVYPQLIPILVGLVVITVGIVLIYTNDTIDQLEIHKDRVEIKSLFGRMKPTIYKNEILAWTEIEKSNKGKSWKVLTLYMGEKTYRISSNSYKNYELIKDELVEDKERDIELEIQQNKKELKQLGFVLLSAGAFLLGIFFYQYSNANKEITPADLTTVEQVVTSPISIQKSSKGHRSIRLKLKDYPDFKFEIDNTAYKATAADEFVANVQTGDTLFVDIARSEYQMKLSKEKELGFFNKTVNYRTIDVYGLRDKNQVYLNNENYNENNHSNRNTGFWVVGILGVIGAGVGLFLLKRSAR
jgi:hypothetical protein